MTDAIPTLDGPALLLAEGGAHAHAAHSSLEAFRLALRLGATSLGARAWLTADGELVLARDEAVGTIRRRRIGSLRRADLPADVPTLDELYGACGGEAPLALTVADDDAFGAVLAIAREHGAQGALWVRHDDLEVLGAWRARSEGVRLVNTVRLPNLKEGAERRAATLRRLGIDAIEARQSEWSGGLVALLHRFGRRARATDANFPEIISGLLRMGLDSIGGDHPDRLADAVRPKLL